MSPGELGRVPGTEQPRGSILQPLGGCSLRFWERCRAPGSPAACGALGLLQLGQSPRLPSCSYQQQGWTWSRCCRAYVWLKRLPGCPRLRGAEKGIVTLQVGWLRCGSELCPKQVFGEAPRSSRLSAGHGSAVPGSLEVIAAEQAGTGFSCKGFLDKCWPALSISLLCPILSKKLDAPLEAGRC